MKSNRINLKHNPGWLSIAALTLLLATVVSQARQTPFSQIIVFGDSLSDTGNFFQLTDGTQPPPPYDQGRFCNGPVWIEYMANDLGMELLPQNDFAVAGATTGSLNSNDGYLSREYPGLRNELDTFIDSLSPAGADPDALYALWAGANDFFVFFTTGGDPVDLIGNGVGNTVHSIQLLWEAGARHILIPNVPDLGLIPYVRSLGLSAQVTALSAAYNQVLSQSLQALADAGIPTIQVDAFATLQSMVDPSANFGFTDLVDPLLFAPASSDPSAFVFWDAVHPTTRAQQILATAASTATIDFFSPSHGQGLPPARVNALKGLTGTRH